MQTIVSKRSSVTLSLARGSVRPRSGAALRSLVVLCIATLSLADLAQPATAGAFATAGVAPTPGAPGLPDGRVYEQVSPPNKGGSEAAAPHYGAGGYIFAASEGNAIAYSSTGPIGNSSSGIQQFTTGHRSATGWESFGTQPRAVRSSFGQQYFHAVDFSADFTKSLYQAQATYLPNEPEGNIFDGYLYDISESTTAWLGQPSIPDSLQVPEAEVGGALAGASSDLGTVYFNYAGTLTPEDEVPNPEFGGLSRAAVIRAGGGTREVGGFYEWHEGHLTSAGVLPNGLLDPYGAVSAGFRPGAERDPREAETAQNQVSEDGSRAFFVSPDPGTNPPAGDVPELYVRETAADGTQQTVLVSRDTLLPPVNGQPVGAPHGPLPFRPLSAKHGKTGASYVTATANGARAWFLSTDQLTADAPADDAAKLYEFNLETDILTYLQGAAPETAESGAVVLASSQDGSRFLFAKTMEGTVEGEHGPEPTELDLWTDGPDGPSDGSITPIAPLHEREPENADFPVVRATSDGSDFVFETQEAFPDLGFNNGDGAFEQIYRYEVASNTLTCLSCASPGVVPTGNADLSHDVEGEADPLIRNRGISEGGSRVFFDSPDALVPQDINTAPPVISGSSTEEKQGYDVYEWEDGQLFLISTGTSNQDAFAGDNSANGNSVFFSAAQGLAPGDTDGGYDVYDARIPQPGERVSTVAAPCEEENCQGQPSEPSLLGVPASATFVGLGNPTPTASPVATKSAPRSLTSAQKLSAALIACKKEPKKRRPNCESRARKKYAPKAKKSTGRAR